MTDTYWAIVPAAGIGSRMQSSLPKQYLQYNSKTVLAHSLECLLMDARIEKIVVVVSSDDHYWSQLPLRKHPKILTAVGGSLRVDSVLNGLKELEAYAKPNDWVLVHDAARPFLTKNLVDHLIETVGDHAVGGLLAVPVVDTLKRSTVEGNVRETLSRDYLWAAQTPQLFRFRLLTNAIQQALKKGIYPTDESAAVEQAGFLPMLVKSLRENLKITVPEDLNLFKEKDSQRSMMRIGYGYDCHRFKEGDFIMLGGVKIPHTKTVVAHSDGDVVLHALADALLGAAALGDIGQHFPDTDERFKNIESSELIKEIMKKLFQKSYTVNNIDVTVIAERPKLGPHILMLREHIASLLETSIDSVSVKAKTNEKMGWLGREEGIAAQAVVTIIGKPR